MGVTLPFVGRREESERLRAHAERARTGVPQLVVIDGPAGVGKTMLVRRALQPYAAWRTMRVVVEPSDRERVGHAAQALLAHVDPELPARIESLVDAALDAANRVDEPTLLIIENLQWADEVSLEATWRMLRRLEVYPALIVVTMRSDERPSLARLAAAARSGPGAYLRLRPFTLAESRQLLAAYTGLPVGERVAERVQAVTGGHPLHVASVGWNLRSTQLGGRSLEEALEALSLDDADGDEVLRRTIRECLDACTPETRRLLGALSLAHRPLSPTELTRIAESDSVDTAKLLDTQLVEADAATGGYLLRHRHAADEVRATFSPASQAALHLALAGLEDCTSALAHRVAAMRLRPLESSLPALITDLLRAGREALDAGDAQTAFEYLRDAAELRPTTETVAAAARAALRAPGRRVASLLGPARRLHAGPVRAAVQALSALEQEQLATAFDGLSRVRAPDSDGFEGLLLHAQAVVEAERLGTLHGSFHRGAATVARAAEALGRWETSGRTEPGTPGAGEATGLRMLLETWHRLQRSPAEALPQTLDDAAKAIATLTPVAGAEMPVRALRTIRGALLWQVGDGRGAYEELRVLRAAGTDDAFRTHACAHLALVLFDSGLWDDAHDAAQQAAGDVLARGEDIGGLFAYAVAALVPAARGGNEHAAGLLNRLDEAGIDGSLVAVMRDWTKAWAAIAAEEHDAAASMLLRLAGSRLGWATVGIAPAALLARSLLHSGRPHALSPLTGVIEDPRFIALDRLRAYALAHTKGLLAWAEGEPAQALADLRAALSRLDEGPRLHPTIVAGEGGWHRLYRALLALDIADLVAAHPSQLAAHRAEAEELAAWAAMVFSASGAKTLAEHAARFGHDEEQARTRPVASIVPTGVPDQLSSLTLRELQIAALIGDGNTNREIANELYLSVRTVEYHVGRILSKLGLASRVELRRLLRTVSLDVTDRTTGG